MANSTSEGIKAGEKSKAEINEEKYWHYIFGMLGICSLCIILLGFCFGLLKVVWVSLLVGFASMSVGFLIGFLFGLPRAGAPINGDSESSPKNSNGQYKQTYTPTTNLEQISDWLTKILIGVGLVELGQIRNILAELGGTISKLSPRVTGGFVLPQLIIVIYALIGFFMGYIWTRLVYTRLQFSADKDILNNLHATRLEEQQISTETESDDDSKQEKQPIPSIVKWTSALLLIALLRKMLRKGLPIKFK